MISTSSHVFHTMSLKKQRKIYLCPVEATLDVIGGKWKAVILFHLLERTIRFGEFKRMLPKITPQMLTAQLRELERDGVIHRKVYKQVPPKVEYSLTPFGQSLRAILHQMCVWGEEYEKKLKT